MIARVWQGVVPAGRGDIRGFAGEDVERARYYAEDRDFLLSQEPTVRHYETNVALPADPGG